MVRHTYEDTMLNHRPAERIFLSAPHMSRRERASLLDAFDSNWIAPIGPALGEFEARLRSVSETEAAVGVTSGTAALHLALLTLDIGPGDIVLCPTVTFVATANVIRYVGATPHFIDCDPSTGNIDPESLVHALHALSSAGRHASALIAVDLYGSCADYTTITAVCDRYGVPIIEDAAEAIGAHHLGRPAGSFGALAAFSFNGNKLVTTGGGGALVGPRDLVERARFLASQARENVRHFEHREVGYAYRLSNLSAAIGCAQLSRIESMVHRTRSIHQRYVAELGRLEGVSFAPQNLLGQGNGWLTVMHLDQTLHPTPALICEALESYNIEARPAWKPMHLQPAYADVPTTGGQGGELHFARGLCLPSGSGMTEDDQTRVIAAVRSLVTSNEVLDLGQQHLDIRDIEVAGSTIRDERARQYQDSRSSTS